MGNESWVIKMFSLSNAWWHFSTPLFAPEPSFMKLARHIVIIAKFEMKRRMNCNSPWRLIILVANFDLGHSGNSLIFSRCTLMAFLSVIVLRQSLSCLNNYHFRKAAYSWLFCSRSRKISNCSYWRFVSSLKFSRSSVYSMTNSSI